MFGDSWHLCIPVLLSFFVISTILFYIDFVITTSMRVKHTGISSGTCHLRIQYNTNSFLSISYLCLSRNRAFRVEYCILFHIVHGQ